MVPLSSLQASPAIEDRNFANSLCVYNIFLFSKKNEFWTTTLEKPSFCSSFAKTLGSGIDGANRSIDNIKIIKDAHKTNKKKNAII